MHSRTEPIKDGIRFSYIFEEGKDVSEIDSIVDYRTTRTIKFDVDYILKNNQLFFLLLYYNHNKVFFLFGEF